MNKNDLMPKRKQKWDVGDVFLIPLNDGTKAIGQIVGRVPSFLNSVTCAFFNLRVKDATECAGTLENAIRPERIFSVLFCTRDLLDSGSWEIVTRRPVYLPDGFVPRTGTGARMIGSGIINKFLNAFYGLTPWDEWKNPCYLDGLLISADKKPKNLVYIKQ
jgi:hypothetical protein